MTRRNRAEAPVSEVGEVFADVLLSATLRDGVVRLEFGVFEAPRASGPGAGREPVPVAKQRLFMPAAGFLRSAALMGEVAKRLEEERGRRPDAAAPAAGGPEGAGAPTAGDG